jgi:hypothetical protein
MGSSNNNIVSQLKSVMNEFKQGFSGMRQELSGFTNAMHALPGFSNVNGGAAPMGNKVAPDPVFRNAPSIIGMTESGNIVAAGPSASMTAGSGFSQQTLPGMENLSQYVSKNPGSGTVYTPASMVGGGSALTNLNSQTAPYGVTDTTGTGTAAGANSIDALGKSPGIISSLLKGLGGGNSLLGTLNGFGLVSSFLPGTDETVQADLLMKRIAFFTNNKSVVNPSGKVAGGQANDLAAKGIATSNLDALNAMAAAQSMGLTSGGSAFNLGVANVSNLTPGMGIEGAMRATGAMQQASSVNMLRGIGIQIRDANGQLKPPDEVIDDVWTKICKDYSQAYRGKTAPSLDEVQIALQPGNSLDSMLNQYFGGDPMLKNMVMNGLLFRAQSSRTLAGSTVEQIQAQTSTAAVGALGLAGKYAASTTLLNSAAAAGAGGFTTATQLITGFTTTFGSVLAEAMLPLKTFVDTLLSASGGAPTNVISALAGLFPGKAEGGTVQGGAAYIVGERGPELFMPGVSGTIIPNEQMQPNQNKNSGTVRGSSNNTYNFNINIPNANTPEVIGALRKLLSDLETNKIVSES